MPSQEEWICSRDVFSFYNPRGSFPTCATLFFVSPPFRVFLVLSVVGGLVIDFLFRPRQIGIDWTFVRASFLNVLFVPRIFLLILIRFPLGLKTSLFPRDPPLCSRKGTGGYCSSLAFFFSQTLLSSTQTSGLLPFPLPGQLSPPQVTSFGPPPSFLL